MTVVKAAPVSCLVSSLAFANANAWYTQARLSIKNNCTVPQNLNNAKISFQSNASSVTGPMWGDGSSGDFSMNGNIASATLIMTNDPLPAGISRVFQFGLNFANQGTFNLAAANSSLIVTPAGATIPTSYGEIDVTINPTGASGINGSSEIDIVGSGLANPYVIQNSNWTTQSTYKVPNIPFGTYTISVKPVGNFQGMASPASVTVNNITPQTTTITYQAVQAIGSLQLSLGDGPNMQNIPATINATVTNSSTGQSQIVNLAWGGIQIVSNLAVGNYSVSLPKLINGIQTDDGNPVSAVSVSSNQMATVSLSYPSSPVNQSTQIVSFVLSGLNAQNKKATILITDSYNNSFSLPKVGDGTVTQAIPVNDPVTVTASSSGLFSNINPMSFTLQNGTSAPTVQIKFFVYRKQ